MNDEMVKRQTKSLTFLRVRKTQLCYPENPDPTCFHISYNVMMACITC